MALFGSFKIKDNARVSFNENIFNDSNRKSDSIWVQIESLLAERMGFEPMCRKPDNRISSAARYDHFDTFPYQILSCVMRKGEMRFTTAKTATQGLRPSCRLVMTTSTNSRMTNYLIIIHKNISKSK